MWRGFSRPARFIILAQTILVGFLSFWLYQEYLNNMYLRIYVNNQIQTMGWALALLMIMTLLGSVMIAVSRNKSTGKRIESRSLEAASEQFETPSPTTTEVSAKPTIDLHPMVAQLKAELAKTMTVESVPLHKVEEILEPAEKQLPSTEAPTTSTTPATVIVGMVPVRKKEGPNEKNPSTEESSKSNA